LRHNHLKSPLLRTLFLKKRQHFEKPSVMRKKKKAAARKRLLKKMRKMNAA